MDGSYYFQHVKKQRIAIAETLRIGFRGTLTSNGISAYAEICYIVCGKVWREASTRRGSLEVIIEP